MFPQVPLLPNLGLGIALVSYNGKVCWGFNADADMVPDVDEFRAHIQTAFERVAASAGVTLSDGAVVNLDPDAPKKKRKRAATRSSAREPISAQPLRAKGETT